MRWGGTKSKVSKGKAEVRNRCVLFRGQIKGQIKGILVKGTILIPILVKGIDSHANTC